MKLSVVLATHNEEANLLRCLDAIKDIAGEIIIVDGESTDETVEIAKKYGAKVIETTNKPIFHINKQMAMDKATGEWVLQLDADEVVDEEMKKSITNVIESTKLQILNSKQIPNSNVKKEKEKDIKDGHSGAEGDRTSLDLVDGEPAAYYCRRKNYFLGTFLTKGGQYPDPVIRFYQNGKASLPQKSVHEQMTVDGPMGTLEGHLLHYNAPTFNRYLTNANRYTELTADEMEASHESVNVWRGIHYFIFQPAFIFFKLYLRHKGFQDGFPGFVFALFSGLHYPIAYIKYWERKKKHESSH